MSTSVVDHGSLQRVGKEAAKGPPELPGRRPMEIARDEPPLQRRQGASEGRAQRAAGLKQPARYERSFYALAIEPYGD